MAEVALHSQYPEDDLREYHSSQGVLTSTNQPSNLLGQSEPYAHLLARFLACDLAEPRDRTFGVVGPTGVGKTSAVRLAAKHAGYHLLEVSLAESGSVNRCLAEAIREAPEERLKVAVLVQSLDRVATDQLEGLAASINSRSPVEVLRKGRAVELPLDRYIWIFEVGGLHPGPKARDPYVASSAIPDSLERLLFPYVRFQALAATDLYAIVSRGLDPTLGQVCSWLRDRGIDASFSEMHLIELAHAAVADLPYSGVRGIGDRLHQVAVGIAMHNIAPEESR